MNPTQTSLPKSLRVQSGIVASFGLILALFLQKAIEVRGVGTFWNLSFIPMVIFCVVLYVVFWKAYSRLLSDLFALERAYVLKVDLFSYTPTVLLLQYFLFHRHATILFEQKLLGLVFVCICVLKVGQLIFLFGKTHQISLKALGRPFTLALFLSIPVAAVVFIRSYDYLLYRAVESRLVVKPTTEVSINNETRKVLYSPTPYLPGGTRIEKQVRLPSDAMLSFGIGVARNSWFQSDTGVEFRIDVYVDDRRETVYSRYLDPANNPDERGWNDDAVELSSFSGQPVTLIFETRVPYSETASLKKILKSCFGYTKWLNLGKYGNIVEAVWSEPTIFSKSDQKGQNVILISFDTLGARHLGCYGYRVDTSPNIDEFASRGVLFKQCVTQSPWTLPAHVSLLTAQNSSSHGVVTNDYRLAESFLTLAEVFEGSGYQTAAITEGGNVNSAFGLNQGFESYDNGSSQNIVSTFGKVKNWLLHKRNRRFFLFVHTYETHASYTKREPYYSRYSRNYRGFISGDLLFLREPKKEPFYFRPDDLKELNALYDGEVSYTDSYFGKLISDLEAMGLEQNTTVIVTSDHGEGFGEHNYYGHGNTLYDELLLVPLILKGPDLPGGMVVEQPVRLIDIMPTALSLHRLPIPEGLDGTSLLPLLQSGRERIPPSFSEVDEPGYGERKKALRTGTMKVILKGENREPELYDLIGDPHEENDLSHAQSKIAEEMQGRAEQILRSCAEKRSRMLALEEEYKEPLNKATTEQLRALGYLQ